MEIQKLPPVHLSASQTRAVFEKMAEALREPSYPYPWASLEANLRRRGPSRLPIVAYGSLLNSTSAAQTLRDQSSGLRRPVIAFGVRRLFNYELPPGEGRYGLPTTSRARAALNVHLTGEINDVVNGILVKVSLIDIPAMRAREVGYDLVPVACLGWDKTEEPPFLAYILRCPNELQDRKGFTSEQIEPHREYYLVCRRGVAELGEDFLRFWLATTYLADGLTPVAEWEATEFPKLGEKETPEQSA